MGIALKGKLGRIIASTVAFGLLALPFNGIAFAADAGTSPLKLRIMETTDIHTNLMSYNYYRDLPDPVVGLTRTAGLIKKAREEVKNSFLIDNGDLIQGTPLGTYKATVQPLKDGELHTVFQAMNLLGYDAATLGNHEFNYGLEFLDKAYKGANFPYVNANVYKADGDTNPDNDVNMYTPYQIFTKTFKDEAGQDQSVKVGVIGFVPPQIVSWDKSWLEGKVVVKDIVTTAEKFVPEMKDKGADVIIAAAHTGFNAAAKAGASDEDAVYPLSKVSGIDAITFSHTHKVFPTATDASLDPLFKDAEGKLVAGVDNVKGTINGVAAVQAGYGGNNLGIIDLTLEKVGGKWDVVGSQSSTRAIYDAAAKKPYVDEDPAIVAAVKADHEATVKYANSPIGTTTAPIHSYFALVQDDPSIQIVTNAQKWYVEKYIAKNLPKYKETPILSVGAPFKAGRNGPTEYTEIKTGPLAIKSAGDLYLYDNTLKAILVKGSVVKDWLEMSAGKFNRIDPAKTEAQELLDPSFQVFNFDIIDGVTFQIDVTKPAKFKANGTINDAGSSRIINLKYNGKPLDPNQEFIVITNNYRAGGGGNFPGVKGSKYVIDSPDENRQILMDYITEMKTINPSIDGNWSIAPIFGQVDVTFTSSPDAAAYAKDTPNIKYTGKTDAKGFGIFSIDLSKTFKDVQAGHWAFHYINDLAGKQIVAGTSDTTFTPDAKVTRAQFATMLVKALNLKATQKSGFKDVPANSVYAPFIDAAFEHKLVSGTGKNQFSPNAPITREQMAVMAKMALDIKAGGPIDVKTEAKFADESKISGYAKAGINAVVDRGVMSGLPGSKFDPKGTASRAQAARVISTLISDISVQILGVNDFHGQLDTISPRTVSGVSVPMGGADYVAAYLKQYEETNPNTLLVHAGDAVGASAPISALLQDEPTIEWMNRLGFDVGTIGNHEFDQGVTEMKRLIFGGKNPKTGADFKGANFPYVVANVVDAAGKPILDPYVVKEAGGVKIGFIGVVTNITPTIVKASAVEGLTFTDQKEAVNKAVAELKAKGIRSIVLLAHDPFEGSAAAPTGEVIDLANAVDDEVDVIFAGHNHGGISTTVDGKLVIEAYNYGRAFSDVDLVIDRATMNVKFKTGTVVDVRRDGITPNASESAVIKQLLDLNAPVLNAPVGKLDVDLVRTVKTDAGESAIGNLIADGMRETMKTDFAFMNDGGIRGDLKSGNVTYGDMFKVQPFGNVLIKMTLTGAQMKTLLEQQFQATGDKIGQVSGFTYSYDKSKPAGQRIVEIKKADGTVLENAATYTIVVNDFMATGGDGYAVLKDGTNREAGPVDLDATISYIKSKFAGVSITAKTEGRIKKLG